MDSKVSKKKVQEMSQRKMHPSTPKILLLILLTVCHMILMKFREFGIESKTIS